MNRYLMAIPFILLPWHSLAQPFEVEMDISRGFNDNVFLESDEILSAADSDNYESEDVQTQAGIFLAYEFVDAEYTDASVIVDYFQEWFDNNELETSIHSYSLPVAFYLGDYRLKTTLSHSQYQLSGDDVLAYHGGKLELTRRFGDHRFGGQWSLTEKTPKDARYDGYNGESSDIGGYFLWRGLQQSARLAVHGFDNRYQDEYLATRGYYVKASYKHGYRHHRWTLSGRYKKTHYNPDPLYTDTRSDQLFFLSYQHSVDLFDHTDLYFRCEYSVNRSTIAEQDDDFNYQQWINSVGVRIAL